MASYRRNRGRNGRHTKFNDPILYANSRVPEIVYGKSVFRIGSTDEDKTINNGAGPVTEKWYPMYIPSNCTKPGANRPNTAGNTTSNLGPWIWNNGIVLNSPLMTCMESVYPSTGLANGSSSAFPCTAYPFNNYASYVTTTPSGGAIGINKYAATHNCLCIYKTTLSFKFRAPYPSVAEDVSDFGHDQLQIRFCAPDVWPSDSEMFSAIVEDLTVSPSVWPDNYRQACVTGTYSTQYVPAELATSSLDSVKFNAKTRMAVDLPPVNTVAVNNSRFKYTWSLKKAMGQHYKDYMNTNVSNPILKTTLDGKSYYTWSAPQNLLSSETYAESPQFTLLWGVFSKFGETSRSFYVPWECYVTYHWKVWNPKLPMQWFNPSPSPSLLHVAVTPSEPEEKLTDEEHQMLVDDAEDALKSEPPTPVIDQLIHDLSKLKRANASAKL